MAARRSAADAMNRLYRRQRHIYDATRKFYLLGRNPLLARLDPPPGGAVLEIACGTGRNLICVASRYPDVQCFGVDVSSEMLSSARRAIGRAGLGARIHLALGDACSFDPNSLFGRTSFDRIIVSYAVSMIDGWPSILRRAANTLTPGGSIHVVDFGQQEGLPVLFRRALSKWLDLFGVRPRDDLDEVMACIAVSVGARCRHQSSYRGYVQSGTITLPSLPGCSVPPGAPAVPGSPAEAARRPPS